MPDSARVRLDENVTFFADALGACERILKTPIPLTYTRWVMLARLTVSMSGRLWHCAHKKTCGSRVYSNGVLLCCLLMSLVRRSSFPQPLCCPPAICTCRHTSRFLVIWLTFMPVSRFESVKSLFCCASVRRYGSS